MARFCASLIFSAIIGALVGPALAFQGSGQRVGGKAKITNDWPIPNNHTLMQEYGRAAIVLLGTFSNEGTAGFNIETVLKSHELIKDKKSFTVSQDVPPNLKNKVLLYCDVDKNAIIPYCGVELEPGGDLVKYLTGAIAFKNKSTPERLRLCFNYLNNPERMVAGDAFREFAQADFKDYKELAKRLPPDTIVGWLKDAKSPADHVGLYALLLGHCGKREHADLLRSLLDDPGFKNVKGAKNLLTAYLMLEPKGGRTYLMDILNDGNKKFWLRYEGLRALRFLQDERPDLVTRRIW